jgi:type I restriction enzyme M protein
MIGKEQWTMMGVDVKGKIYEGLLEKMPKILKVVQGNIFPHVP